MRIRETGSNLIKRKSHPAAWRSSGRPCRIEGSEIDLHDQTVAPARGRGAGTSAATRPAAQQLRLSRGRLCHATLLVERVLQAEKAPAHRVGAAGLQTLPSGPHPKPARAWQGGVQVRVRSAGCSSGVQGAVRRTGSAKYCEVVAQFRAARVPNPTTSRTCGPRKAPMCQHGCTSAELAALTGFDIAVLTR